MLFTLEALQAKHGDSLILHYGDKKSPRFIVIDGGPATVYKKWLGPRLEELREKWGATSASGINKVLPIDLLMVSHIDDDHINGVLALFDKLDEGGAEKPYKIATLWHNAFDDILGNDDDELRKAVGSELATAAAAGTLMDFVEAIDTEQDEETELERERIAVAANVPQGQRLRDAARKMKAQLNCLTLQDAQKGKTRQLISSPKGAKLYDFNGGLNFCILGPAEDRLTELQKEWAKAVRAAKKKKQSAKALAAAYLDKSAFNLSSIVIVAELGGKRMLLTGDARGDYVLEGLKNAKLLKNGKTVHFDLLKVMHHGSDRNVEQAFFETVTADHYVVSADGKHNNPDIKTLEWIADARGDDQYVIHMTNRDGDNDLGKKLTDLVAKPKYKHLKTRIKFRGDNDKGMKIDLLEAVTY